MKTLVAPAVCVSLLFSVALPACGGSRHRSDRNPDARKPAATSKPLSPPPPGPATPAPTPAPAQVMEISALLEQTHPELLVSLAGLSERVGAAARAPARDPIRAEHLRKAMDGTVVLALLTQRLSSDPSAANMRNIREWLAGPDGQTFHAARKHAIEVRANRNNLAGGSIERRNACRRLILALGDGRFSGRLDFAVVTQTFLGPGLGHASKATADVHKSLIAQGPWILERASDLAVSTGEWSMTSLDATSTFWESPMGKDWVDAIDRHLGAIVEERLAEAERTVGTP